MAGITRIGNIISRVSRRAVSAKVLQFGIAACALSSPLLVSLAMAPAAQAAALNSTATIQALLNHPVNGVVNLPAGSFTIRPTLRLSHGERIAGHHTTLTVAASSGNYAAVLTGASTSTDLSGLSITGVTFNQNAAGDPITSVQKLDAGQPRFVILVSKGNGITITGDKFLNTNNVNTIVTGSATSNVTISRNTFTGVSLPWHDHSSIYTSGTTATITGNTFTGTHDIAAIEVHGDRATITGNTITGYYRGANIAASDTTFTGNTITHALGPVDLWSTVAPGLHNITVTGNTLNQNLTSWASYLHSMGIPMPAGVQTQQVFRQPGSTLHFSQITIRGNRG
jgi:hypothetical protein